MKIYARFHCYLTDGTEKTKKIYKEFKERMKNYLLDSGMGLYRVPIDTEDYLYAEKLAKEYWDEEKFMAREDECGKDGLEISSTGLYERVYDKKDYQKAAAYRVWFLQNSDTYDDLPEEVEVNCCDEGWKNGIYNFAQVKPYYLPKHEFGKKNCAQLDNSGYVVSKEVREDLMQLGALEEDFWPVYTKKKEIVCYQLMPQHKVSLREVNGWEEKVVCPYCGCINYYDDEKNPIFIDKKTLESLKTLNATEELLGGAPVYLIINKEAYEFLTSKYKRMNFEPIFLKE